MRTSRLALGNEASSTVKVAASGEVLDVDVIAVVEADDWEEESCEVAAEEVERVVEELVVDDKEDVDDLDVER